MCCLISSIEFRQNFITQPTTLIFMFPHINVFRTSRVEQIIILIPNAINRNVQLMLVVPSTCGVCRCVNHDSIKY